MIEQYNRVAFATKRMKQAVGYSRANILEATAYEPKIIVAQFARKNLINYRTLQFGLDMLKSNSLHEYLKEGQIPPEVYSNWLKLSQKAIYEYEHDACEFKYLMEYYKLHNKDFVIRGKYVWEVIGRRETTPFSLLGYETPYATKGVMSIEQWEELEKIQRELRQGKFMKNIVLK